jgi:hypothetical protein
MKNDKSFASPTQADHGAAHTLIGWAMPQMAGVLERAGSNNGEFYCIVCVDPASSIMPASIGSTCMDDDSPAWLLLLPMATVKQMLSIAHRDHDGACAVACLRFLDKAIQNGSIRVVVFTDKVVVPMVVKTGTPYVVPVNVPTKSANNSNRLLN